MSAKQWTLAIDFGTSYSVAAAVVEGEAPRVVEVDGELRVPSVILVDGDSIVVGRIAEEISAARPASTLRAPKSRLGDQAPVILADRTFQIVPLVGALLKRMYDETVVQFGGPPHEVRLTYPATWSRTRQARLLEAAESAGIPVPMLVAEPVAAALSYWNQGDLPDGGYLAVYDLGGGTFDSAILRAGADGFTIVGRPDGDSSVGGELFDEVVVNLIGSKLDPAVWEEIQLGRDALWQQSRAVLRKEARRAKETLSSHPWAEVLISLPTGLTKVQLVRSEFDEAVGPFIDDSVRVLRRCVAEAGITGNDLAAIQLVGGSSRIPMVTTALSQAFPGIDIQRRGDPKNSVALGALVAREKSITPIPVNFGSSEDPRFPPANVAPRTSPTPSVAPVLPPTPGPPSVPPPAGPVSVVPPPPAAPQYAPAAPTVQQSASTPVPPPPPIGAGRIPPSGSGPVPLLAANTAPPRRNRTPVLAAVGAVTVIVVAVVAFFARRDNSKPSLTSPRTTLPLAANAATTASPTTVSATTVVANSSANSSGSVVSLPAGTDAPPVTSPNSTPPTLLSTVIASTDVATTTTQLATTTTVPPQVCGASGLCVGITGIVFTPQQKFLVTYAVTGFTPDIPGANHLHFFYNTVLPADGGAQGKGPWEIWDLASGGGQFIFNDWDSTNFANFNAHGATAICVGVANHDHTIQVDTVMCMPLGFTIP